MREAHSFCTNVLIINYGHCNIIRARNDKCFSSQYIFDYVKFYQCCRKGNRGCVIGILKEMYNGFNWITDMELSHN